MELLIELVLTGASPHGGERGGAVTT